MDKYCNSVWYIITIGAICVLCHSLNIPVTGAALLTVLIVAALLFCKNMFVLTPVMLMGAFVVSYETSPRYGYFSDIYKIVILCVLASAIIVATVLHFWYYGNISAVFKRLYLTVSFSVLSATTLVGGLFAPLYHLNGILMSLAIAATMFVPYSLLVNCGEYDGKKTIKYFVWTMIVASIVIGAAVLKQYALHDFVLEKGFLEFGYAISNSAAVIVLMAIPATFYLIYSEKLGYLYWIAVVFELTVIAFTFSRASLAIALPGTLIVGIVLCFKKKVGRLGYYISFGLLVVAAIISAIVLREKIFGIVHDMFSGDVTGSGRTVLWKWGYDLWKDNPIFGIGIWYLPQVNTGHFYHSFHCTPLTYLYCCGIVGLAAYVYHRYKTVRLFFEAKLTAERVFVALSIVVIVLNSLLDTYMTEPLHLMYYSVLLALIEMDVNKTKTEHNIYVKNNKINETESVK